MNKSVCLLSGGMDSAVSAAIAKSEGYEIFALHANYGQRTHQRESKAAKDIADYLDACDFKVVDMNFLREIGYSALTSVNIDVPQGVLSEDVPPTYVPFRNTILLSLATAYAETLCADAIFIGSHREDFGGYPDNRPEYIEAMQKVIELGTRPQTHIKLRAPLLAMDKRDIIKKGFDLEVPFDMTWSCYKNNDKACGLCESCLRRLRAFKKAGYDDPIEYENIPGNL